MSLFDFEQQLVFYGKYHSHRFNILVHIVCVPMILWTSMALLAAWVPPFVELDTDDSWLLSLGLAPNLTLAATLGYLGYYLLLEPVAGAMYAPILMYMCRTATSYGMSDPTGHAWIAGGWLVAGWVLQILSHQAVEGRSPALMDNLAQALLLAPLFVFLEVLFYFGYRPALQRRVRNKVGVEVTQWRREQARKVREAEEARREAARAAVRGNAAE